MTSFSIDVASANSVASALESEEESIVAYVRQTVSLAEEINSTWKGVTPEAFQLAKQQWDEGIAKMEAGMANACATLRASAVNYQNTDEGLRGLFSGFSL